MGERLVASFSEPKILEGVPGLEVYTKKQAFGILSDYFVMRANEVLNTGETPDIEKVKSYLSRACDYGRCKLE